MMVRREYELVPVVFAEAEFQQLVEPFTIIVTVSFEQRPFEKLRPVILSGLDQDVGCCEKHMGKGKGAGLFDGGEVDLLAAAGTYGRLQVEPTCNGLDPVRVAKRSATLG